MKMPENQRKRKKKDFRPRKKNHAPPKFSLGEEVFLNVFAGRMDPKVAFTCKGIIVRLPYKYIQCYKVIVTEVNPKPLGQDPKTKSASRILGMKLPRNDSQLSKTLSHLCLVDSGNIDWLKLSKVEIDGIKEKIKAGKFKPEPPRTTGSQGIRILRETRPPASRGNQRNFQKRRNPDNRQRPARNSR